MTSSCDAMLSKQLSKHAWHDHDMYTLQGLIRARVLKFIVMIII